MADSDPLLEAARFGDEGAWAEIVRALGPRVVGYARAKGIADPEDLMQEVFLAAAQRIGSFEGSYSDFRSWVFAIAHHRIVDEYRRRARTPQLVPVDAIAHTAPSSGAGPVELVIAREDVVSSVRALDGLSPIERDVVLLRVVAELSSEEVGSILSKRPGTIRVMQSRALEKLKRVVQEQ
ncbi:MAG: RNA polymerase sigma factor [Acidimicrobiia bacterium]|nr:RNA polymerase sigma factor [Acidimicrobiia bacterium]MBT8194658.1 RNA polymerase sigma factor [Acidimicrobiia bacterium]NNF87361.1 RNA polymerase sigma factor [Acidimicrobiia bacterium]NNJ46235.1 RNA polymerase sigma factor [Acidimicrobiia bacterium]NNL12168.1 RNA polymerase sigma factor [Acidimicrobiia bacterium]